MLIGVCLAALNLHAAGNDWMTSANGALALSQFSIPGTHDSGALYEPVSGTAKCQNLSIADQLSAGARFLDIRCRHVNDAFAIHHGSVYQNMNFDDVLNAVIGFLNGNPNECVIMSVKEEYDPSGNTRSFEATFDSYVAQNPAKWLLGSAVPTLNAARGKIVLVRRFGAGSLPKGIDASAWADNTTFTTGSLRVQDYYNVSDTTTKWNTVTSLFDEALGGSAGTLYLNFCSGYKSLLFGIPSIPTVSDVINPNLTSYFGSRTNGRYGVVIMDFADAARSSLIYRIQKVTTALSSSLNPSVSGQWITLTAALTGTAGTPTGTVTFRDGAATLGTVSLAGSGVATLTLSNLSAGAHSVTAVYSGNATYGSSTSAVLTQTVTNGGPNVWTGASGNVWDINASVNWNRDGAAGKYREGDEVVFDDTATGSSTLLLTTTVNPGSLLVSNRARTYILSGSGAVTGPASLVKEGAGLAILNISNNFSGATVVKGGTLSYSSSSASTGNGSLAVGAGTGNAAMTISTVKTLSFGGGSSAGSGGNTSAGLITHLSGTLNLGTAGNYLELGGGGGNAFGAYVLNGGTLNTIGGSGIRVGAIGLGTFQQTGGILNCGRWFALGTTSGSGAQGGRGVATFTGGTANIAPAYRIILGDKPDATGVLNLGTLAGGAGVINSPGPGGPIVFLNDAAATLGIFNLNSGTLQFGGAIFRNAANTAGAARLNFNGGTLQAVAHNIELIGPGPITATVFNGGGVIDSRTNSITLSVPLNAAAGNGIYPAGGTFAVSSGGSGYLAAPLVTVSGGSGSNATANAAVSAGVVSAVVPTCPGEGYEAGDVVNFTFSGGGPAVAAPVFQRTLLPADIAPPGSGGLTKLGPGTLLIRSTNSYAGPTLVSEGTLQLTGKLLGSGAVTVQGTLQGTGMICGPVTLASQGKLLTSADAIATLTVSNSLTLASASTCQVKLNAALGTCDSIEGLSTMNYGGTLVLTNLAGDFAPGDSFKLFSATAYAGAFDAIVPAVPKPGLVWNTGQLVKNGTLRVTLPVNPTPPELSLSVDGNALELSWPADRLGWRLLAQTNELDQGLGTDWYSWPDSTLTNFVTIPINPANPATFFRLTYP